MPSTVGSRPVASTCSASLFLTRPKVASPTASLPSTAVSSACVGCLRAGGVFRAAFFGGGRAGFGRRRRRALSAAPRGDQDHDDDHHDRGEDPAAEDPGVRPEGRVTVRPPEGGGAEERWGRRWRRGGFGRGGRSRRHRIGDDRLGRRLHRCRCGRLGLRRRHFRGRFRPARDRRRDVRCGLAFGLQLGERADHFRAHLVLALPQEGGDVRVALLARGQQAQHRILLVAKRHRAEP